MKFIGNKKAWIILIITLINLFNVIELRRNKLRKNNNKKYDETYEEEEHTEEQTQIVAPQQENSNIHGQIYIPTMMARLSEQADPAPSVLVNEQTQTAPLNEQQTSAVSAGNKFCEENCIIKEDSHRIKNCLIDDESQKCQKCKENPAFKLDPSKNMLCKKYCNAVIPNGKCKFYGYFSGKLKKNFDTASMNKYKLQLVKKFREVK